MSERLTIVLTLIVALFVGAMGTQGCRLYNQHIDQHRIAEGDHQLLQQIVPIVNALLDAEKARLKQK